MIKPTIGRIVQYYPSGIRITKVPGETQPLAAMITHVWSDTCINIACWDENGVPFMSPPTSVLLIQDDNPVPSGGFYCIWPPKVRPTIK